MKISITRTKLARIRQAVGGLPADEREVLMLVCSEGLSYRNAAEELGISQDELKCRLLRARQALMKTMSAFPHLLMKQDNDLHPMEVSRIRR
ncbi:sigma factor-like helix-turn-helix DNA-binding protein [Skermanella aerolata]|uniref:sigma factor-like helix-turn-helix DNA-binding protein n=1 Tax=Skermanella aerolata TaxID=393310 RepID=UPI003D21D2B6